MSDKYDKILSNSIVTGHFVYKALHKHGAGYVDKEKFSEIGSTEIVKLIEAVGENALKQGINFPDVPEIGILAPAYGALMFPLILAAYFEKITGRKFFPARTEAIPSQKDPNKLIHFVPGKRKEFYQGKCYMILEDIVNNGTTVKEVKEIFKRDVGAKIFAALCVADRGGQTAKSLGIRQYYPLKRVNMTQHDLKLGPCPLCEKGIPINTLLGKGKRWVAMFGQPPYSPDVDFSPFWNEK